MRIRLLHDLPLERKHGMTAGRVLDTVAIENKIHGGCWVKTDVDHALVRQHEYELVGAWAEDKTDYSTPTPGDKNNGN